MGKSLKGTQTEKNLCTSFAGESQARNRYTENHFADLAHLVEQHPRNVQVLGSSLGIGFNSLFFIFYKKYF